MRNTNTALELIRCTVGGLHVDFSKKNYKFVPEHWNWVSGGFKASGTRLWPLKFLYLNTEVLQINLSKQNKFCSLTSKLSVSGFKDVRNPNFSPIVYTLSSIGVKFEVL